MSPEARSSDTVRVAAALRLRLRIVAVVAALVVVVSGITTRAVRRRAPERMDRAQARADRCRRRRRQRGAKRATLDLPGGSRPIRGRSSMRASPATSKIGRPTSARRSRPASCSPRSRRPTSISRSCRRRPTSQRAGQRRARRADRGARRVADLRRRCRSRTSTSSAADFAAKKAAGQVGAGQPRPAARAGELQAHRRAVRRHRDGARRPMSAR